MVGFRDNRVAQGQQSAWEGGEQGTRVKGPFDDDSVGNECKRLDSLACEMCRPGTQLLIAESLARALANITVNFTKGLCLGLPQQF